MKRALIFFASLFLIGDLIGQVITSSPPFPTKEDSIIITFDATKGDQGLMGYTGNVFVHTGVTINGNRWQNVIGDWGNDTNQPQLTRIADDLYELVIGFPHEFYDVNPSVIITEFSFVFRGEDGSGVSGRDEFGADIFMPLFEPSLNVAIVKPQDDVRFANMNDVIDVLAITNIGEKLQLFVNNELVSTVQNDSLTYSFTANTAGKYTIKAIASLTGEADVIDSTYFITRGQTTIEPLPDGIELGINYLSPTEVTLALFAPGHEFVYALGDFSNWELDFQYEMKLTPDSSTFWLTLSNLIPGKEYGFLYILDDSYALDDPYADKILDPWEDKWIPESVYPNLKPYPTDDIFGIISVFQTNQQPYNWLVTDFQKPAVEDLVIYEMWLSNFIEDHSYKTLIDTLSYLERLGVNVIELMPVNEFEGNISWGYNPSHYLAPDKYYGTKEDLKAFIDAAHEKGIAVIIDMVLNHAFGSNPLVQQFFSSYRADGELETVAGNPYFNVISPNRVYYWGADFNHESEYTQKFVDRVNTYWLNEFNVDGFRFDFTKGFTNKAGDGWSFDQSRIDILKRMADVIWEADSNAYVILEHLTDNAEEKILADYGMLLWGNMNYNYNEATMGYNSDNKSDLSRISYKARGWNKPHLVGYMESHDEERLMFKNLEYGNSDNPEYDVTNLGVALDRVGMAAAFFFTVPGPKMILQFGELGFDYSINYPCNTGDCRTSLKPFIWDTYYNNSDRQDLYKTFKALISLKKNYETFKTTDFSISLNGPVKRINLNHWSMNATIIGNFDVVDQSISPNFQTTGTWYDYFTSDSITVSDVSASIELEPGEFHIYTSKKLPQPDVVISSVENEFNSTITDYSLEQNYPNPFNPTTTISYSVKEYDNVSLVVYDVLGRVVARLLDEPKNVGRYSVEFDASNLSSGIYFYTINSGSFSATKKLMLLK